MSITLYEKEVYTVAVVFLSSTWGLSGQMFVVLL